MAVLTSAFILAGCSAPAANLPEAEKNLHEKNTESGQIAMDLANDIVIAEDGSANYEEIATNAGEAKNQLNAMKTTMEGIKVSPQADQLSVNAITQVSAVARIAAKVQELANSAINAEAGSEELDQVIKQLEGLKLRLESSQAKFTELNQELTDVMANPQATTETEEETAE